MGETTNPKKEGKRIYDVMQSRNPDPGATTILVIGGMGGVKTSACLDYVEKIMQWQPDERVFWRESLKSPVQFKKIIGFDYTIFVEKDYNLVFKNIRTNKVFKPEIVVFKDFDELLQKSKGQTLNVVFFKQNTSWVDFIQFLNNNDGWFTIAMDEIEDVFPSETSGEDWKQMQKFANIIKHCRRGLVTLIGNTQQTYNIDHRIRSKIMIHLYGFGAKLEGYSRINRKCLDNITKGEFWIEEGYTRFGYIKIKKIHKPQGDPWTIFET